MSSAVVMERAGLSMPSVSFPTFAAPATPTPSSMPVGPNWLMVPRCTFKFEKCTGGMKVQCVCADKLAVGMVQNLCTMLAGGMYSCQFQWNGMTVCTFNFTMCTSRCEPTDQGVCVTCTSGDTACCDMVQAYCDCFNRMVEAGCTCAFFCNNTPVCCGAQELVANKTKTSR